jgi:diaminopimelate epimerase
MRMTTFFKYQGTGNDFIMIDDRNETFPLNDVAIIAKWCDRKFGIGADGLILLQNHDSLDFKMVYFNADGNPSSMCGNGGRCIARFAQQLGIVKDTASFDAVDGTHHATLTDQVVSLHMSDVNAVEQHEGHIFTNTGSPHHIQLTQNIGEIDVFTEGKKLRYALYGDTGANINFVEPVAQNHYKVRTYERGVENETLSCGTGVTAVALAMHAIGRATGNDIILETPGGKLQVAFKTSGSSYRDIWLTGPATAVFKGTMS